MSRSEASAPAPFFRVWEVAALAIALLLALALRLWHLGDGLWFDEIKTLVEHVRLPFGELLTTLDSKNRHMLFSVLAKGSIGIFGESAASLRLPAALLGTASLAALYVFGRLVTIRREALFATLLLAVSYHHVWFSQNARGYTGLLLFTLLASYEFLRLLDPQRPAPRYAPYLYGLWVGLAMFTHFTGAVVPAAHFIVLAWLVIGARKRGEAGRQQAALRQAAVGLGVAAVITLLLYAPVLPQVGGTLLAPTMEGLDVEWKNPVWALTEALTVLGRGVPGGPVTIAIVMIIPLAGVVSYARTAPVTTAVMVLPAVLTAIAILGAGQNLWPRFFFFSAGFAALLLMRGLSWLAEIVGGRRSGQLATGLAAAAVLASALTVPRAWAPKQDFEGAARWVREQAGPEDAIVAVDMTSQPYEFLGYEWPAAMSLVELEREERPGARTWILYTFPPFLAGELPDLWERISSEYETVAEFYGTLNGGVVIVAVRE